MTLLLMAAPCAVFVLLFNYVPLFGWIYAFFDYKPGIKLANSEFVGLKYFKLAFQEPELLSVMTNTLALTFLSLCSSVLPVAFAIFLSEMASKNFRKVIQTLTTIPFFISWVLVYAIFFTFFSNDGFINNLLIAWGWIAEPMNPLANPKIVWVFQTCIGMWKGLGFAAIIYIASMTSIDSELYDAAKVDGAGRYRSMLHITIPGLVPTFITLTLLSIGNALSNGFEQYFVFYNPLVHSHIQVLDYYLYRMGIVLNDYSLSTALGMYKTIISIILLFTVNWISKKTRGQAII